MVSYFVQTHPLGTDAELLDMVGTIEDTTHWDREVFHTQYGSLEATQVLWSEGNNSTGCGLTRPAHLQLRYPVHL